MNRLVLCASAVAALAVAGCVNDDLAMEGGGAMADAVSATAELRDPSGRAMGAASATQSGDSILIRIEGMNLPSGSHGAHVHMAGVCAAPAFETAGGHWNPTNQKHGKDNPAGLHKGDLPNIAIGTNGRGMLEYMIPGAWLAGGAMPMLDGDGAALVIHAAADDYRTDPSGASGERIACGVFR